MIYILTGPIGSGKTTKLEKWVKKQKSVGGILMPVIEGKRHLYSIHSGELIPVELKDDVSTDEVIKIGKYRFSKNVFEWGNREILNAYDKHEIVIIDEIGPLELNGKGFYSSLTYIFSDPAKIESKKTVIVVRKGFVEKVTGFFSIKNFRYLGY